MIMKIFLKVEINPGAPNDRFLFNICSERYRFPRNFDTAKDPTNFEMAIPFI